MRRRTRRRIKMARNPGEVEAGAVTVRTPQRSAAAGVGAATERTIATAIVASVRGRKLRSGKMRRRPTRKQENLTVACTSGPHTNVKDDELLCRSGPVAGGTGTKIRTMIEGEAGIKAEENPRARARALPLQSEAAIDRGLDDAAAAAAARVHGRRQPSELSGVGTATGQMTVRTTTTRQSRTGRARHRHVLDAAHRGTQGLALPDAAAHAARSVTGVKGAIAGARLSAAEVEREGGRLTQKVIDGAAGRHARMELGSEGASLVGL